MTNNDETVSLDTTTQIISDVFQISTAVAAISFAFLTSLSNYPILSRISIFIAGLSSLFVSFQSFRLVYIKTKFDKPLAFILSIALIALSIGYFFVYSPVLNNFIIKIITFPK